MDYLDELKKIEQEEDQKYQALLEISEKEYNDKYDEVYDEYLEKRNNLAFEYSLLFKYQLISNRTCESMSLYIFDKKEDNVVYVEEDQQFGRDIQIITLSIDDLNKIKDIIALNEVQKLPQDIYSHYLEGVNNNFAFVLDDKVYKVYCNNLWAWEGEELAPDAATKLINIFYSIMDIINTDDEEMNVSLDLDM